MRLQMLVVVAAALASTAITPVAAQKPKAEAVTFPSADKTTQLRGYLFKPSKGGPAMPAVVIMHGIGGAYSPQPKGRYDETTLSLQYKNWIDLLLKNGFAVLLVDDYGAIGHPAGLAAVATAARPQSSDPIDARPLHLQGALRFLQSQRDVAADRIGLLGWQVGGSAALAAMGDARFAQADGPGFAAAAAIFPGCGRLATGGYKSDRPVRIFMGAADKVLQPAQCEAVVAQGKASRSDIEIRLFEGAGHNYTVPLEAIQSVPANAAANAATRKEVVAFLNDKLGR